MLIDQDKELKQAILDLSYKEKEKLLLKLISKDRVLFRQLRHQLVDGDESLDEKREAVVLLINNLADRVRHRINLGSRFFDAPKLSIELRAMSGLVNEHFLITKDKLGEIEMRLHILELAEELGTALLLTPDKKNQKLAAYIAGRMKYVLKKYEKLHEDIQYDMKDKVNDLLAFIHHSAVAPFAADLVLPKEI